MGANDKHAATHHDEEYDFGSPEVVTAKRVKYMSDSEFNRWLEQVKREAKAKALEEAAHDIDQIDIDGDTAIWIGPEQEYTLVSDWLRNRAAQLKDQP